MEGNRRNSLKTRSNNQFKKKGVARKGRWQNSGHEPSESSDGSETIYRILCQSRKIGNVIGKGGNIVKALREETQAKISIADPVPGSEERVIMILSPSTKEAIRKRTGNDIEDPTLEKEDDGLEPHCAAQDALLKVHNRIVQEDIAGKENEDENDVLVTSRLLVSNSMVGCILGRKGDVIQRLRTKTGANIRVFPAEHLSGCAMSTDELVQIQGNPAVAMKALYQISTLLHQNPRKDRTPSSFPSALSSQDFRPLGLPTANLPPLRKPMWSPHNPDSRGMHPVPWPGRYETDLPGQGPGDFDDVPPLGGGELPSEFAMKILCPSGKIGGVIGKGGLNVRQLQIETGASIHVEDVTAESDDRVICVSSIETLWSPRSQTIDAILQLQSRSSEFSEKGIITTRLLVPSSKVGCLLGQGGRVINEMRRRSQADIRVFSKEEKPECASSDEELVQISGSIGVAKDALTEIASRLRTRCLRDPSLKSESAPIRPLPRFPPAQSSCLGTAPSVAIGAGTSGRFEQGSVGNYEGPAYRGPSSVMGYTSMGYMHEKVPQNTVGSVMATGSGYGEIAETRYPNHQYAAEFVDIHSSAEHLNRPYTSYPMHTSSAGQSNQYSSYHSYNDQRGHGPSISPSMLPYRHLDSHQPPYQAVDTQHTTYHNSGTQALHRY